MFFRVWHDNSGNNPSWFFSRLQVTDLQTDDQYFFIYDRWLAVEEDDGMVGMKFEGFESSAYVSEITEMDMRKSVQFTTGLYLTPDD